MASSSLRTPVRARTAPTGLRGSRPGTRRSRTPRLLAGGLVLAVAVIAGAAVLFATSRASLQSDGVALAKVKLPIGGGSITHVSVVRGRDQAPVPARVVGGPEILPQGKVTAGRRYTIQVIVARPGWISWLGGKKETITRTVTAPAATLRTRFVTLDRAGSLRVRFDRPVRAIAYGARGHLARHLLASARRSVSLPHDGSAGTTYVAAEPQSWESSTAQAVSWFPAGTKASAVASPAPGGHISASTPITLTFSETVARALGSHLPVVSPTGAGSWHRVSTHAIVFRPSGYGFGLDQKVKLALPAGVRLAGGTTEGSATSGTWTVPAGSTTRLQQILAELKYLPVSFHYAGQAPGATVADQERAAVSTPQGSFGWRWSSAPSALRAQWKPGTAGTITRGAVMMFESENGMTADGVAGSAVWKALVQAMIRHRTNTEGYTFVQVSEGSPESLQLWHDGRTVLSGIPVNTGVAGAPTATGTYPVFEHAPSVTMIGTNVDGSKYDDPDIKWVSYFNGGDALHAYPRASYGSPQSNGCVEMDTANAARVYPYTPIGALVDVT